MQSFKDYISESKDTLIEAKTKYSFKKDVESAIKMVLSLKGEQLDEWEKPKYYNMGNVQEAQVKFEWNTDELVKLYDRAEELRKSGAYWGNCFPRGNNKECDKIDFAITDLIDKHVKEVQKKFGFKWKNKKTVQYHHRNHRGDEVISEVTNISDTLTAEYSGVFTGRVMKEKIIFRHKAEEGVETDFTEFPECKVGAIYQSIWGYNNIRVSYYQVIARKGSMVFLKELNCKERSTGYFQGYITPIKDSFLSTVIYRTKVSNMKIDKYRSLQLWDGKEEWFDYND